jgi:hypothetical protein
MQRSRKSPSIPNSWKISPSINLAQDGTSVVRLSPALLREAEVKETPKRLDDQEQQVYHDWLMDGESGSGVTRAGLNAFRERGRILL